GPVAISLQRYNDSLSTRGGLESTITSAITCLEALYLRGGERAELSRRLGQRASALLRVSGLQPIEVCASLTQAYSIRSTFIHGAHSTQDKLQTVARLAEKTLDYARLSILAFLQLMASMDKEKLIGETDKALLDDNARSELEALVRKTCTF
ncbi:MAG: HEPN domain-containing protein, partial [Chloroflexi bacterium]|nr:HEPN domain-containing protein [Chloroflexota bacterium]